MSQSHRMQYLAAFAVSIATMTTSTAYFWTAPILPKFHNNETSIVISNSEISWVVAIISPGMVTGSLAASGVSDKFGRRVTLLASALPFIVGTVFVLHATKPWLLYIGRFSWGLGSGMITTVTSVYLSEIADKEIRGTLTAGTRFMFSFGALLMLAIGSFVSYQVLSYFLIVMPICYFLACWRIPETPYYLLKEGKVDVARKELLRLSGSKNEKMIDEKLSQMRSDVRKEMQRSSSVKELLTGKQYRKAVIVTAGLRFTQLFAGSIPIQQYMGRIIQQSNCGLPVSTALIIFGAVRFAVGLISPMIVDRVGRRPLLIYSYLGSCVMLAMVGVYFFLQQVIGIDDESSNPFRFVVFLGIIISIVISSVGFDTLIFIIPSEIFPLNVRSVAMTVLNIFSAFITFIVVKGYQPMEDWTGLYGVFWLYAVMACTGAIFTYAIVPETKGKSLREIQVELQGDIYDTPDDQNEQDEVEINENTELKDITR
ncbi:facilitated trehalose transporter Tret1-like isoform X10 [Spodoptera frugiperda]|uniref:Facilitated trehalose transporter Tret1-like isoform X10 n=1 Tax=Spodoptera frugiperda TaxID=7108 RepID=A0A9R0F4Z1_SPOFR|nr:facilitated trehalose transporter Tret1-like isoform X2 [Spodoptera frugiperda]XP_050560731.1 facilitated trehalose transporter Tret1-like isoform X8 [Spodoptera frugiperda]XP_050560732.1 facilitated trehalose transporter Tret1-like isoform X9 [Spodoptera frugiperda]XP_050560733.1 facilitated trehalose transporter Tret1-like isoform X10 [Spodoptera frugiperda]